MRRTDLSPDKAPAYVPAAVLNSTPRVEPLTCAIGAEISNVNLGLASRDSALMAEVRALLLKHKVLFFRDQNISRAEHVAFASYFGELEDHPVERVATRIIPASCGSTSRPIPRSIATRMLGCDAPWREKLTLINPSCHRKMLRAGITGDTSY